MVNSRRRSRESWPGPSQRSRMNSSGTMSRSLYLPLTLTPRDSASAPKNLPSADQSLVALLSWTLDTTVLKSQGSPFCSSLTHFIAAMKIDLCPPHNFKKNSTLLWSSGTSASSSWLMRSSRGSGTGGVQNTFCLISEGVVQLIVAFASAEAESKSSLGCLVLLKRLVKRSDNGKMVCASSNTKIRSLSSARCNASVSRFLPLSFVCVASSTASMIFSAHVSSSLALLNGTLVCVFVFFPVGWRCWAQIVLKKIIKL